MRKGQVTLFVVLGIILVVLVAVFIAYRDTIMEQAGKVGIGSTLAMSNEAKQVQAGMGSCLKNVAEMGVILMGLQGGYTVIDDRIKHTTSETVLNYYPYEGTAYFHYSGQDLVPTKEMMAEQLAYFINANSKACETQYEAMEVNYGPIKTTAQINDDNIEISVTSPIKIIKEGKESTLKSIDLTIPVRLGRIQSAAKEMVKEQIRAGKGGICTSCIANIAEVNELKVDIDPVSGGTADWYLVITDEKSKVGGQQYIFIFASKL
jgi:hypothetical protein